MKLIKKLFLINISIFLFIPIVFSQTKVQKLYEGKKYKKCLKLCDKNILENKNKKLSILFKSIILSENYKNKEIIELYPNPVEEALKGINKIEKYRVNNFKDNFYLNNKRLIKKVVSNSLIYADEFLEKNENSKALKIYKKLRKIYPKEKIYLYKISKAHFYNREKTQKTLNVSVRKYHNEMYLLIRNARKHFKNSSKYELESSLEILYETKSKDLELISIFLVFLKKDFNSSKKINKLYENFQERYWQIDMLKMVNDLRAKGCVCGDKKMEKKHPLVLSSCLNKTSAKYARLMNKEGHFSHIGPSGTSPWDRAKKEGCIADGENIAAGSSFVEVTFNQWKNSTGHCKNMMGNHLKMGIGKGGKYWVQMFL